MTRVPAVRIAPAPNWLDSLLFLALMSGPPRFRERDAFASLSGEIDLVVLIHVATWTCGGLWVLARLYPAVLRRNVVPSINPAQALGALFIAALTLSVWESPGILLTLFTLGQFVVMLGFTWVFAHRFGTSACLRHLFIGVSILALATVAAVFLAPELVIYDQEFVTGVTRIRGDLIADTGTLAVVGLVLCLSNTPRLSQRMFWVAVCVFGALLAASRSRSAYIAFVAYLGIGFIHGKGLRVRQLVLPLTALALTVLLIDALPSTVDYLVRERDSVETMSDRIPLWQYLTTVVMRESPITGMGYYAASRLVATEYNPVLGNAHSAFFEVLVGGGLVGAALYLALCASLASFALRLLRLASGQPSAVAAAGLLFAALVIGLTTPASLQPGPLGFAFWSLTALLPALAREAASARIIGEQRLYAQRSSLRVGDHVSQP